MDQDSILLHIFSFLNRKSLYRASLACKQWYRIAYDDILWRNLLFRDFKFYHSFRIPPTSTNFLEYKHLYGEAPTDRIQHIKCSESAIASAQFTRQSRFLLTLACDCQLICWRVNIGSSIGRPPLQRVSSAMLHCAGFLITVRLSINEPGTKILVAGVHQTTKSSAFALLDLDKRGKLRLVRYHLHGIIPALSRWLNDTAIIYTSRATIVNGSMIETLCAWDIARNVNHRAPVARIRLPMGIAARAMHITDKIPQVLQSRIRVIAEQPIRFKLVILGGENPRGGTCVGNHNLIVLILISPNFDDPLDDHSRHSSNNNSSGSSLNGPNFGDIDGAAPREPDHVIDLRGRLVGLKVTNNKELLLANVQACSCQTNPGAPPELLPPRVLIINLDTLEFIQTVTMTGHTPFAGLYSLIMLSPDVADDFVITCSAESDVFMWSLHHGVQLARLPHAAGQTSALFCPTQVGCIVTADVLGCVSVWASKIVIRGMLRRRSSFAWFARDRGGCS